MKQPFRYFRGEFNGKFLYNLAICPNFAVQDVLDELVYQTLFQWKLEDEITRGEVAIRFEDIINIAKIAGLFQLRSYGRVSLGSVYFTPSHVVKGKERSERGLMDMSIENFKFVRTEHDEYPDDIVNDASEKMKQGLVPAGTAPIGYVRYDTPLYTDEGEIIEANILPEPPTDAPYITYYGEKFLIHEEFFNRETPLPMEVFKLLFECMQKIRYNGPTIASFLEITGILGAGYIHNIEIVPFEDYYTVYYSLNNDIDIEGRDRRFAAWLRICEQKFKLYVLELRY